MNTVAASQLDAFARQFNFRKGRLRGVRVRDRGERGLEVELRITARTAIRTLDDAARPVRLRLVLSDAEEYRFQKRPNFDKRVLSGVAFGYFDGLFFVNLDAWDLEPGEKPAAFDFRASEAYVAAAAFAWEEVTKDPPPSA